MDNRRGSDVAVFISIMLVLYATAAFAALALILSLPTT
jgi:hypothetical protein